MSLPDLFEAVQAAVAENWPGRVPVRVAIYLHDASEPISLPLPLPSSLPQNAGIVFVPNAVQRAILDALEGKGMRSDALGAVIGDKRRLYRHPGGIKELTEQGLIAHHKRVGYYRPDAPPEALAQA